MCNNQGYYKLIDFGNACSIIGSKKTTCRETEISTPAYRAPEMNSLHLDMNKYYKNSDIYAVGVMLFALLTGKFPSFQRPLIFDVVSSETVRLKELVLCINDMLALDPNSRMNMSPFEERFKKL